MGRHSRRGPAPKGDSAGTAGTTASTDAARQGRDRRGHRDGSEGPGGPVPGGRPAGQPGSPGQTAAPMAPPGPGAGPAQAPPPRRGPGAAAPGRGPGPDGTPAQGFPRVPAPNGTPAHGVPRFPDGTPAHGVPRMPDGTPAHGVPRFPDGTPAHGVPQARGAHPEQREAGGGWGEFRSKPGHAGAAAAAGPVEPTGAAGPGVPIPRQRRARSAPGSGPRQDYLDAFRDGAAEEGGESGDGDGAERGGDGATGATARSRGASRGTLPRPVPVQFAPPTGPTAAGTGTSPVAGVGPRAGSGGGGGRGDDGDGGDGSVPPAADAAPGGKSAKGTKGAKGRTFTGIAAAAVTTVLAVVVAGQVADDRSEAGAAQTAGGQDEGARTALGGGVQASPSPSHSAVALTYEQKMNLKYPLSPALKGSGRFDVVPGFAEAPGHGRKFTYRVDVEQGLGLDGRLFADAVQKTLNDDRSWAHGGARTFERVSSGESDFVITLASPGTTAVWCEKSGLDTTEDNVSCDSAATPRVMINAYRWAQGARTYGDRIYPYRQMLINHEVGHRLGHNHVTCEKDGELAPVMQQQTKFLDHDGIHCLPNSWPYPKS
ncbi:DUF3152 domain-containing protein [Streptomyces andamanensis]|uniref:DUF3152 domain-containing protein n=1 Tax=Streptomyces andamanensis TaxID=1565035 RepID=A0ABV8TL80_9ACTN